MTGTEHRNGKAANRRRVYPGDHSALPEHRSDVEAEQRVVNVILGLPERFADADHLDAGDFTDPDCRKAIVGAKLAKDQGWATDPAHVAMALERFGDGCDEQFRRYLDASAAAGLTPEQLERDADTVLELSRINRTACAALDAIDVLRKTGDVDKANRKFLEAGRHIRDLDAERRLLGTLLRFPYAMDDAHEVCVNAFTDEFNRKLFEMMRILYRSGTVPSAVAISEGFGEVRSELRDLALKELDGFKRDGGYREEVKRLATTLESLRRKRFDHGWAAVFNLEPNNTTKRLLGAGLNLVRGDQVKVEPIDWAAENFFVANNLNLIHARGGLGKSTVAASMAADWSTGRPLLGLRGDCREPCDVLMLCFEDDVASVVVPRLKSHQADLFRIHFVQGVRREDGTQESFSHVHIPLIEQLKRDKPMIGAVIIDPAPALCVGKLDPNKADDVRSLTHQLIRLAQDHKITFILITHDGKAKDAPYSAAKALGSVAWIDSCRQTLTIIEDDKKNRILVADKVNLTAHKRGRIFRMESLFLDDQNAMRNDPSLSHLDDLAKEKLLGQLCRVAWEEAPEDLDVEAAVKAQNKAERGGAKALDRCKEFLASLLADFAYPSTEIDVACKGEGFGFQTIKQAKKELKADGVITHRLIGFGRDGVWWSGPGASPKDWVYRPERDAYKDSPSHSCMTVPDCPSLAS